MKLYTKFSSWNDHTHVDNNGWLEDVQALHEYDNRIIRVDSVKKANTILTTNMEKLDIDCTLFEYVSTRKPDYRFTNFIISEYIDIFSSFFKFSRQRFKCDKVFYHHDYTIDNVVLTKDKKVKVIDLEDMRYMNKDNCYRYWFGKYHDGLSLLSGAVFYAKNGSK